MALQASAAEVSVYAAPNLVTGLTNLADRDMPSMPSPEEVSSPTAAEGLAISSASWQALSWAAESSHMAAPDMEAALGVVLLARSPDRFSAAESRIMEISNSSPEATVRVVMAEDWADL